MPISKDLSKASIPNHVAVIMDGNGRWAIKQNKPRTAGHMAGIARVREMIKTAATCGIQVLTLFAWGRENWRRPDQEIDVLMSLFVKCLIEEVGQLHDNQVVFRVIGDRSRLSKDMVDHMNKAEDLTRNNTGLMLNIAIDYSGQWDIEQAFSKAIHYVQNSQEKISSTDISISSFLPTRDLPHVDLLIRTSGEQRLSNFLLWQLAYAELYFVDVCFPDFDQTEFYKALDCFKQRQRRFGRAHTLDVTLEDRT